MKYKGLIASIHKRELIGNVEISIYAASSVIRSKKKKKNSILFFESPSLYIRSSHIQESEKQKKKKEKNKTHRRHEFIIQQRESFDYEALN